MSEFKKATPIIVTRSVMINLLSHKDHIAGTCKTDMEFSISHGDGRASLTTQIESADDLEKIGQDFLEAAKIRRAMETI